MISVKASSICGDQADIRYQKAIKEISKLITHNNEIKEELNSLQQELDEAMQIIDTKDNQIHQLSTDRQALQSALDQLSKKYEEVSALNIDLKHKLQQNKKNRLGSASHPPKKGKNNGHCQQSSTAEELSRLRAEKRQQSEHRTYKIDPFSGIDPHSLPYNDLAVKLKAAEELNKKISQDNRYLRSRLLKIESSNAMLKVKNIADNEPRMGLSPKYFSNEKPYRLNETQMAKTLKHLKRQSKQYEKKFKELKQSFDTYKTKAEKLETQNSKLKRMNEGFSNIIKKQESYMKSMIESFEQEFVKKDVYWKQIIQDQKKNNSPTKNAKMMRMIESLQHENKGLKKKFQLCSMELTKCFKTLEAYKAKLAECELHYQQLAKQRESLMQKLNKCSRLDEQGENDSHSYA